MDETKFNWNIAWKYIDIISSFQKRIDYSIIRILKADRDENAYSAFIDLINILDKNIIQKEMLTKALIYKE